MQEESCQESSPHPLLQRLAPTVRPVLASTSLPRVGPLQLVLAGWEALAPRWIAGQPRPPRHCCSWLLLELAVVKVGTWPPGQPHQVKGRWERLFAPVGLTGSYYWTRLLGGQTGLQVGPLLPKGSEDYPGAPTSGWEHPVAFPSMSAFQLGSRHLAASMACSSGERPAEGAIILRSLKAETPRWGQGHL